jgi:hypothetical protein
MNTVVPEQKSSDGSTPSSDSGSDVVAAHGRIAGMNGAQALIRTLTASGVDVCFATRGPPICTSSLSSTQSRRCEPCSRCSKGS